VSETSDLVAETVSNLAQVEEFLPRRFLRNGHLQTLIGNFKPRQYVLTEAEARLVEVDPGNGIGDSGGWRLSRSSVVAQKRILRHGKRTGKVQSVFCRQLR
jgi:predicted alpha/beta-fold hydrolase